MGMGHILVSLKRIENIEQNGGGGNNSSTVVESNIKDVAIPLLADGWTFDESANNYYQTAIIDGLTETANPIILLSTANEEASEDELNAYKCITEANINEGSITFVADEKPAIGITLIVKNVVASDSTAIDDITALVDKVNELEDKITENENTINDLNNDIHTKQLPVDSAAKEILEEGRYYCARWSDVPFGDANGYIDVKIVPNTDNKYRTITFSHYHSNIVEAVCKMNDGVWQDWYSYAKNSDINDITTITSGRGTAVTANASGLVSYYIKNGICYVTGEFTLIANSTQILDLFTGLPTPKGATWFTHAATNGGQGVTLAVMSGTLKKYYAPQISGASRIDFSTCYPIA